MKALFFWGILLLAAVLAGCGDDNDAITVRGPGLVGIDDSAASTAPLLRVTYTVPTSPDLFMANILSDPASDGDIEFNRVLGTFTVTTGPPVVFFGEDSLIVDFPEFRAFLTFPLDGSTNQPAVPGDADIVSASLEVFVDRVRFASVIPTFLDLVEYPFRTLSAADFDTPPIAFRTLNFFSGDQGRFVGIDVTRLMEEAQLLGLLDFQVRLSLQALAAVSSSRAASAEASRSGYPSSQRSLDDIQANRGPSSAKALSQEALASRRR